MERTSSFNDLVDSDLLSATVHVGVRDDSELTASSRLATHVSAAVHSPLERVALPAEDVVSVLTEAGSKFSFSTRFRITRRYYLRVTLGEDEGLAAVRRPHVVELSGVPSDFEEEQRHTDGMRRGAATTHEEKTVSGRSTSGVRHMAL